jgi:aspartate 1-decarboxylase
MAYADMSPEETKGFSPKVVFVDEKNNPTRVARYEKHGLLEDLT